MRAHTGGPVWNGGPVTIRFYNYSRLSAPTGGWVAKTGGPIFTLKMFFQNLSASTGGSIFVLKLIYSQLLRASIRGLVETKSPILRYFKDGNQRSSLD